MPAHGDPELLPLLADLNGAAERIWQACSPTCPELSIEVLPEIGSTNTELMARGRRGEVGPVLLAAALQTAGRGRHGRVWQAQAGHSLTFSLGLPLSLDAVPGGGSALSLAVGLALAQALDTGLAQLVPPHLPRTPIGLKWPNDLWCLGRKLGGILIEASPAPGLAPGQRWVVMGVGLNVLGHGHAPAGSAALIEAIAGAQPGAHQPLNAGVVWSWLAPALIVGVRQFEATGFAPVQPAYAQRDVLAGQAVGLWPAHGASLADGQPPSQTGVAQGVSETGALLVHTAQGLQQWTTGDVSVRLQASCPPPASPGLPP